MKYIYVAAAIIMVAAVILLAGRERIWSAAFGPADLGSVNFISLQLKNTPNQFLMCPPAQCTAAAHATSPVYAVAEQTLRTAIIANWSAMPRIRLVAGSNDPASGEIRFVQYSPKLGFPDTISVQTYPLGDSGSTLAIYSRSQVGKSDLGVNAERVSNWIDALPVPPKD